MPFVERNQTGDIVGLYARPQPGRAEEFLADDHADVTAFQNTPAPPAPLSAEEIYDMLEAKGILAETDRPRLRNP